MAARASTTTVNNIAQARNDVLVTPEWLAEHLHDPAVRVVEVDVNTASYDEWHIDGAVLWNVYSDLKDPDYRLVDDAAVEDLLTRSGITSDSTVVFYGYAPAMGFWLMRLHGHADLRILDCARQTWGDEGLPWSIDAPVLDAHHGPDRYVLADQDRRLRAGYEDVKAAIDDPSRIILDVRSEAEFRGERFWPSGGMEAAGRAGHVPSAINLPLTELHDERGSFLSEQNLRQIFAATYLPDAGDVITYCTIGGRACTAWFVLTYLLGREQVYVYDGSWADWGRTPDAQVETTGAN